MRIQKLYVDKGRAEVIDPVTGEMVKAEFGHLHYGTNDGREAVSVGMWMSHQTNMNERGIDSHLTSKERSKIAKRDYGRFWVITDTKKYENKTITKELNRKTGNVGVHKFTKYTNKEGHNCRLEEFWSEKIKPFSGVLTVNGLDVMSGW